MDIRNTTPRPLVVPLPGGKKLFLGPGKTGQVSAKAEDHPPLQKLVENGELEILAGGRSAPAPPGGGAPGTNPAKGRQGGSGGIRHVGDRGG